MENSAGRIGMAVASPLAGWRRTHAVTGECRSKRAGARGSRVDFSQKLRLQPPAAAFALRRINLPPESASLCRWKGHEAFLVRIKRRRCASIFSNWWNIVDSTFYILEHASTNHEPRKPNVSGPSSRLEAEKIIHNVGSFWNRVQRGVDI